MRHSITTLAATTILTAVATSAVAGPGPRPGGPFGPPPPPAYPAPPHPGPGNGWVLPLVTGTVLGAVIASQPRTVVVQPAPVPVQPASPTPGTVYKRVQVFIPECNCYRTFDVPIN